MIAPRIFVSYAFVDATHRDYQFTTQLVNDLRAAGAEVFVDEVSSAENNLAHRLNQVLPNCHWVVLVQTPEALRSTRVQLAVNTALNLVVEQRMQEAIRVISEPCDPGEVPPTWTTLKVFDASQDYPRALTRVLLALGLVGQPKLPQYAAQSEDALQFLVPYVRLQPSSIEDRPVPLSSESVSSKSAIPPLAQFDRTISSPALSSSERRRLLLLSALLVAVSIVLIIASIMIVYAKSSPNRPTPIPVTATSTTQSTNTTMPYPATRVKPKPSVTAEPMLSFQWYLSWILTSP